MTPARRRPWGQALLFAYFRRLLRRHFYRVVLYGDESGPRAADNYPLVCYSTHPSWWDGFLEVLLVRRHRQEVHLMMEERNLRKFPLFRWVGVFGVDVATPAGRAGGLLHGMRLMRDAPEGSRRCLYFYPHGRLVTPWEPWPPFPTGAAALLGPGRARAAVPVAKLIHHGRHQYPEAFLEMGPPLFPPAGAEAMEQALRGCFDRLMERARRDDWSGGVELLPPGGPGRGETD